MNLLNIAICLSLSAVGSKAQQESVRITEPFQISPYVEEATLFSDTRLVPGARKCGGTGKLIKIRHELCTTGETSPCVIPHNRAGRGEVVFVPSETTKGLGIVTRLAFSDGQLLTFEHLLPEMSVVAGQEYVLTATGGSTSAMQGKHVSSQSEIYRLVDKQVEICGEVDLYIA